MHKLATIGTLALALLCTGCPGLGQVGFTIDSKGQSTIQGNPLGGVISTFPAFGGFSSLNFAQDQSFRNNNTDKDHVDDARLTTLKLKIVSPSGANLDFIDTIEFDIGSTNLPTIRIAEATVGKGLTTIDLSIDDHDLAAYVKANTFSISTKATGRQPNADTTLEADLSMHIVAHVL